MNLLKKAGLIIYDPDRFFKELKSEKGIYESLIFLVVIFLVLGSLLLMFKDPKSYQVLNYIPITSIVLIIIFNVFLVFPISYLNFMLCKLFKGNGVYEDTFKVAAYSSLPAFIMFLPYLGSVLALTWIIILNSIGLTYAHKIKISYAAIVSISTNALLIVLIASISYFVIS